MKSPTGHTAWQPSSTIKMKQVLYAISEQKFSFTDADTRYNVFTLDTFRLQRPDYILLPTCVSQLRQTQNETEISVCIIIIIII